MELFEFSRMLKELGDYYERAKEPRHGTIELWFDKVKNIPTEPISWITSRIEAENESFPRNLPSALWVFYREWLQQNSDRVAHQQHYSDCPDCTDGLMWAKKGIEGVNRYSYVFRCARCKQNEITGYPMAGRLQLMRNGYDVIPKGGDPYTGPPRPRNVHAMVAEIGVGG